jgi:ribonuclease HI
VGQLSFFEETAGASAVANVDGGSRGNPGPAGYGVRIEREDGTIVELKEALPRATNNVAEYNGLLAALRWAAEHGVRTLHVKADSELLVKQMRGEYRVKNPGLQPLYEEARALVKRIGRVTFEHVRREFNKDADRLANEAMDEAAKANAEFKMQNADTK